MILASFIEKLTDMRHLSPVEHVTFTFGIEGISRACSHQIVRHRLASYSQQESTICRATRARRAVGLILLFLSIEKIGGKQWFIEKMETIQKWYDELVEMLGNKGESAFEDARFCIA